MKFAIGKCSRKMFSFLEVPIALATTKPFGVPVSVWKCNIAKLTQPCFRVFSIPCQAIHISILLSAFVIVNLNQTYVFARNTKVSNPFTGLPDFIVDVTAMGNTTGTSVAYTNLVSCSTIKTDAGGNFSCGSGSGTPGGLNTQVQYNNSSAFDGTSGVTWTSGTSKLAFADATLLDLSAINQSASTEGFLLPQGAGITTGTQAGQLAYDTTLQALKVGDGTSAVPVVGGLFSARSSTSHTTTFYWVCQQEFTSTTATRCQAPYNGRFFGLSIAFTTAPGAGNSWACTARANASNTAVTCTVSGTNKTCQDNTNTGTVAVGQNIDVVCVATTPTADADHTYVLGFLAD